MYATPAGMHSFYPTTYIEYTWYIQYDIHIIFMYTLPHNIPNCKRSLKPVSIADTNMMHEHVSQISRSFR